MSHGHTTQRPLLSILPFNNSDNKQQSQSPPTKRHCIGASRRAGRQEQRVSGGSVSAASAHRIGAEASMKRSRVICCGVGGSNHSDLVYAGSKSTSQRAASNCHLDSATGMSTVPGVLAQSASDFCLQSHGMSRAVHVVDENRGAHNRNSDTNNLPIPSAVFSRHEKDSGKRHDHHHHHDSQTSDPPTVRSGSMVGAGAILSGPGGLPRGTAHSHQLTGAGSSHNNGASHMSDRYASGAGTVGAGGTSAAGVAAAAPAGGMHTSASDKMISKKDKARQKFSHNLLKRAKVLISDRASQNTQPYKVSATTPLNPDKFKVLKLKAAIDKKPTTIDERSTAVLKYRTPHFRLAPITILGFIQSQTSV